jgi:hypothetical protein
MKASIEACVTFQRRPICIALMRPVFTRSQAVQ